MRTTAAQKSAPPSSLYQSFRQRNLVMTRVQPSWITPAVAPDPRLVQYARFSFTNQYTAAHTQTVNYGNTRGMGIILGDRVELDYYQPPYIQHNSAAADGFGDNTLLGKVRLVSGNADHGNYIVSAILSRTFATGSHSNGALTGAWGPTLSGGVNVFKRYSLLSGLGGNLPTGKIAAQGRSISWNNTLQARATEHLRLEIESNSTYYFAGSHDGKMQNFVTPVVYYVLRPKRWEPTHLFYLFDVGFQTATSGFHTYNHNTIAEMRVIF